MGTCAHCSAFLCGGQFWKKFALFLLIFKVLGIHSSEIGCSCLMKWPILFFYPVFHFVLPNFLPNEYHQHRNRLGHLSGAVHKLRRWTGGWGDFQNIYVHIQGERGVWCQIYVDHIYCIASKWGFWYFALTNRNVMQMSTKLYMGGGGFKKSKKLST